MLSSLQRRNYIRDFPSNFLSNPIHFGSKIDNMSWLTGGKQGEAKRLIAQLADSTKRDRAAQELIRLDADALPALLDALQTKDPSLLPLYEQVLARLPSAAAPLTKTLATAHPILRARVADVLAIRKDRATVPALQAIFSNRADRELQSLAKEAIRKMN
jgi:HEAT repeat protein